VDSGWSPQRIERAGSCALVHRNGVAATKVRDWESWPENVAEYVCKSAAPYERVLVFSLFSQRDGVGLLKYLINTL